MRYYDRSVSFFKSVFVQHREQFCRKEWIHTLFVTFKMHYQSTSGHFLGKKFYFVQCRTSKRLVLLITLPNPYVKNRWSSPSVHQLKMISSRWSEPGQRAISCPHISKEDPTKLGNPRLRSSPHYDRQGGTNEDLRRALNGSLLSSYGLKLR